MCVKSASEQRGGRVGADARRTQIAIIGVKFLAANTVGDPDWNPNENLANFVCSKNRARCRSYLCPEHKAFDGVRRPLWLALCCARHRLNARRAVTALSIPPRRAGHLLLRRRREERASLRLCRKSVKGRHQRQNLGSWLRCQVLPCFVLSRGVNIGTIPFPIDPKARKSPRNASQNPSNGYQIQRERRVTAFVRLSGCIIVISGGGPRALAFQIGRWLKLIAMAHDKTLTLDTRLHQDARKKAGRKIDDLACNSLAPPLRVHPPRLGTSNVGNRVMRAME